jgi:NAD+ diphosphatase
MLGFDAPWVAGDPAPLEGEIADARWFSRDEVAEAAALDVDGWGGSPDTAPSGDGLLLPPRLAIARRLLEGWLAA